MTDKTSRTIRRVIGAVVLGMVCLFLVDIIWNWKESKKTFMDEYTSKSR